MIEPWLRLFKLAICMVSGWKGGAPAEEGDGTMERSHMSPHMVNVTGHPSPLGSRAGDGAVGGLRHDQGCGCPRSHRALAMPRPSPPLIRRLAPVPSV